MPRCRRCPRSGQARTARIKNLISIVRDRGVAGLARGCQDHPSIGERGHVVAGSVARDYETAVSAMMLVDEPGVRGTMTKRRGRCPRRATVALGANARGPCDDEVILEPVTLGSSPCEASLILAAVPCTPAAVK